MNSNNRINEVFNKSLEVDSILSDNEIDNLVNSYKSPNIIKKLSRNKMTYILGTSFTIAFLSIYFNLFEPDQISIDKSVLPPNPTNIVSEQANEPEVKNDEELIASNNENKKEDIEENKSTNKINDTKNKNKVEIEQHNYVDLHLSDLEKFGYKVNQNQISFNALINTSNPIEITLGEQDYNFNSSVENKAKTHPPVLVTDSKGNKIISLIDNKNDGGIAKIKKVKDGNHFEYNVIESKDANNFARNYTVISNVEIDDSLSDEIQSKIIDKDAFKAVLLNHKKVLIDSISNNIESVDFDTIMNDLDNSKDLSEVMSKVSAALKKSTELMAEYDWKMKQDLNSDDLVIKNIDVSDSNGTFKIGKIFLNRDTSFKALTEERARFEVDLTSENIIASNDEDVIIHHDIEIDNLSDLGIISGNMIDIDINQLIPVAIKFNDEIDYVMWYEASLELLEILPNTISDDLYSEILALSQKSIPSCGDAPVENPFSTTWETCSGSLENVEVFPNPVNDLANVKFNLIEGRDIHYTITDLNGKEFITIPASNFTAGNNTLQVDMSNLSPGIYYLKINTDQNERIIKRVIKK